MKVLGEKPGKVYVIQLADGNAIRAKSIQLQDAGILDVMTVDGAWCLVNMPFWVGITEEEEP